MKHFKLKDDSVRTKLHLVDTIFNTPRYVEIYVNGCGHTVYRGDNAEEFAEKLAAEVDAAEEAHIAKLLKQNGEESAKYACKVINGNATDDGEKPITDINGRTIEPIQIAALYINEFGDVRAILGEDDIVALKHFKNTEKDNAYIDELAKRCNLYAVTDFRLFVDPASVKKVFIDYDDNADYVVFVQIYDFDLPAATFNDCDDAAGRIRQLKKDFNL